MGDQGLRPSMANYVNLCVTSMADVLENRARPIRILGRLAVPYWNGGVSPCHIISANEVDLGCTPHSYGAMMHGACLTTVNVVSGFNSIPSLPHSLIAPKNLVCGSDRLGVHQTLALCLSCIEYSHDGAIIL